MTESYYSRGSIRSSELQSSNQSAASPVSARNALLSASSINALVTDRELFSTSASVVPKLRAAVNHGKDANRSSTWQTSTAGNQLAPGWVVKKKQHGAQICEFDRSKLPSGRSLNGPSWLHRSSRNTDIRHSMVESRRSLYTRDGCLGEQAQPEIRGREQSQWPLDDDNVAYAVTAQVTLGCRLEEAMTMLFSRETLQFDASMAALFGSRKYRNGDLLVSREFRKSLHSVLGSNHGENDAACWDDEDLNDLTQPGWIALQSVVLRSRRSLNPVAAAKHGSRRQRLCFAAYSQQCATTNEAFYVMRTLQKPMHDQFIRRRGEHIAQQALRGDVDHIAAGYHLTGSYSDVNGHQTRIVMTAYVATPTRPNATHQRARFWTIGQLSTPSTCHNIPATVNIESKYVVNLLALATMSFDQLVRRRRLGYQTLSHVPARRDVFQEDRCKICKKNFGFLRPERFCQLCAQIVCRDCSRKFDVEPIAHRVRKNRICFNCVANVDASVFQNDHPTMESPFTRDSTGTGTIGNEHEKLEDEDEGVKISTAFYDISLNKGDHKATAEQPRKSLEHRKDRSSSTTTTSASLCSAPGRQLADALFSGDPLVRARALEVVRQVVMQVTTDSAPTSSTSSTSPASSPYSASLPILHPQHPNKTMVDKYLEARLHLANIPLNGDQDNGEDTPRGRSNSFCILEQVTTGRQRSASSQNVSSTRVSRSSTATCQWTTSTNMETELDLDDDLDSAALDAICEVAAMRLQCPVAYIVALNGAHSANVQRMVGSCGVPRSWAETTVCPFSLVSGSNPFVIKDPMSDPHLRRLQVGGDTGVRFFAGFPIKSPDESVVACLCTVDCRAREKVAAADLAAMRALAKLAADLFEEEVNPYTPRSHS